MRPSSDMVPLSVRGFVVQEGSQAFVGIGQGARYRASRDTEHFSDLGFTQVSDVAQHNNLALSRWEAGDDLPDLSGRSGDRDVLRPFDEEATLDRPPSSCPTGMIQRNTKGPSRRGLQHADLVPLLQRTSKRRVDTVGSQLNVAGTQQQRSDQTRVLSCVPTVEGLRFFAELHQLPRFVGSPGHHVYSRHEQLRLPGPAQRFSGLTTAGQIGLLSGRAKGKCLEWAAKPAIRDFCPV